MTRKVLKKAPKRNVKRVPGGSGTIGKKPIKEFVPLPQDVLKIRLFKAQNLLLMGEGTKRELVERLKEEFGVSDSAAYGLLRRAKAALSQDLENESATVFKGIRNELFGCLDQARRFGNLKESVNILKLLISLYGLESKNLNIELKENNLKNVNTEKLIQVLDDEN